MTKQRTKKRTALPGSSSLLKMKLSDQFPPNEKSVIENPLSGQKEGSAG